jgi:hypothetical protein
VLLPRAGALDDTHGFHAGGERRLQRHHGPAASNDVGVVEIDAERGHLDPHLTGSGRRDLDNPTLQDLGRVTERGSHPGICFERLGHAELLIVEFMFWTLCGGRRDVKLGA